MMPRANRLRPRTRAALSFAVGVAFFDSCRAASTSWTYASTTGTWQTASNWNNGAPTALTDAIFYQNNVYSVVVTSAASAANLNVTAGDVTLNPGATTIQAGTINLSAGSLTTGSLVYGSATAGQVGFTSALNFTGGTLTINGGVYTPKLQTIYTSFGTSSGTNYTNSALISGAAGSTARPVLRLVNGGTLSIPRGNDANQDGALVVGVAGGSGGVVVDGAASVLTTNAFQGILSIGNDGTFSNSIFTPSDGSLTITNGGMVNTTRTVVIAQSGGNGRAVIDGANSKLTTGVFAVGASSYVATSEISSAGVASISNGGAVSVGGYSQIGNYDGTGTLSVSGANSKMTVADVLTIGAGNGLSNGQLIGGGTLLITSGGQVAAGNFVGIGYQSGRGNALIDGTNSKLTISSSGLDVGYYNDGNTVAATSVGTLTISNNAVGSFAAASFIGGYDGIGTVNVSGASLTVKSSLAIGDYSPDSTAAGTLTASSAGTINTASALIGVSKAIGYARLTGAGTTWTNTSTFSIGSDGTTAGTGSLMLDTNAALINTGTLSVYTGGTLSIASGASVNTGSLDVTVGGTLKAAGGTLLINGGGLYLPAAGLTFGDGTTASTLQLHNATVNTGPLTIAAGSTFKGQGTVSTKLTLNPGATLVPGETIGKLTAANGITLSTNGSIHSVLQLDIGAGTTAGTTFDQVAMTGGVFTVGGATLLLSPVSGIQLNHVYPIVVTSAATVDSTTKFSNLTGGTNFNDGNVAYQVTYSSSEIDVSFTAVPEPAALSMLVGVPLIGLRRRRSRRDSSAATSR